MEKSEHHIERERAFCKILTPSSWHDIIHVTSQMMDLLFICDSCDYDDFVVIAERESD